ncbi:isoprenylcysteine carboxylmethyltransferase family protein [Fluviibacterium sp. DFM31]|uniref:Isoprenylcysteine carboxylmethyltransferase family protein n=1 Tax=Meridianimarinicoccus marinus TaxID=3231483 RepID=A0ABV3LAM9_9RHOB
MEQVSRWLDWPPLWLALFLGLARVQSQSLPLGGFPGAGFDLLAGLCIGAGLIVMALAVLELRRQRTTILPHRVPDQLAQQGIFRRSRNPIYLGDALVLTGFVLYWDAVPSLLLVPLFMWVITDRFIQKEEATMAEKFGPQFDAYTAKTRRWI